MTYFFWYLAGCFIAFMLIIKRLEEIYRVSYTEEIYKDNPEACIAFCIGSLGSWFTVVWLLIDKLFRKCD